MDHKNVVDKRIEASEAAAEVVYAAYALHAHNQGVPEETVAAIEAAVRESMDAVFSVGKLLGSGV